MNMVEQHRLHSECRMIIIITDLTSGVGGWKRNATIPELAESRKWEIPPLGVAEAPSWGLGNSWVRQSTACPPSGWENDLLGEKPGLPPHPLSLSRENSQARRGKRSRQSGGPNPGRPNPPSETNRGPTLGAESRARVNGQEETPAPRRRFSPQGEKGWTANGGWRRKAFAARDSCASQLGGKGWWWGGEA